MALFDEVKQFVENKFGVYSAAKIEDFKKEVDPETNPKEFLEKCEDFLATILTKEKAQKDLQGLYEKYVGQE